MARHLVVARSIRVAVIKGLTPPSHAPQTHPLLWIEDGTKKHPPIIRFSWNPITSDLYVGVQCRHVLQIPRRAEYPFAAYLRGFSFWPDRVVALRTYYWPLDPTDWWDHSHRKLDQHVAMCFLTALRPSLPDTYKTMVSVDNKVLRSEFGHLALDW